MGCESIADMRRTLWLLRSLAEGILGLLLLLVAPELILMYLHSEANLGFVLGGLLLATTLLVLGFFLFRDAVRIRMRLKGQLPADQS
jgi:hypothetical protein